MWSAHHSSFVFSARLKFAGAVGRCGSISLDTYCSAERRVGGYGKTDEKRAKAFGSITYFRKRKAASLFPPFGTIHVSYRYTWPSQIGTKFLPSFLAASYRRPLKISVMTTSPSASS